MKITQLATSHKGGAGMAAQRLHLGLLQAGADSNFLSLDDANELNKSFKVESSFQLSFIHRVKRKLGIAINQAEKNNTLLPHQNKDYEIFSFPFSDYRVEQNALISQTDVINLHWIAGLVNYNTFFALDKPIVWTMHDMNPFMGGFHYEGDFLRNQKAFNQLEQQLITHKKHVYQSRKQRTVIVTPSAWLKDKALNSSLLGDADIRVIPNGIDTTVFKLHNKEFARSVFNLPLAKKIVLFVSDHLNNHRKGFDLLAQAINEIKNREDILLLTVGNHGQINQSINNIIHLGAINDERLMSLLYAAADVFVLPSREDNLPNVLLESTACGTPVIAFKIGGVPEVIQHGFNGILADEMSVEQLVDALLKFIDNQFKFDAFEISKYTHQHYALAIQAHKYINLYNELA